MIAHNSPTEEDPISRALASVRLAPVARPFAHAVVDPFFRPETYEALCDEFPALDRRANDGSTACSLYMGDEAYERHLEQSPAWNNVFELIHSQRFVDFMIEQFGECWKREGCKLDLSRAKYVPYVEDRVDKHRPELRQVRHDPHELWCRLDFHESYGIDYRPLHRDQRRRLISMLVFFDGKEGSSGGEIILHPCGIDLPLLSRLGMGKAPAFYSRARDRIAGATRLGVRRNRMIAFLNSNRSWHSVVKDERGAGMRHVRIVVSSSVNCWA